MPWPAGSTSILTVSRLVKAPTVLSFSKISGRSRNEIRAEIASSVQPKMFEEEYANVFSANETWNEIAVPEGERYAWVEDSTYIRRPTFFEGLSKEVAPIRPIADVRVLAKLGDSVTTDHISPAGSIAQGSPAATYLSERSVERGEWNSYGSRRGNHEVMERGTFANIRIRNELVPGVEGGVTRHLPSNEEMTIYDASARYTTEGTGLVIIGGKEVRQRLESRLGSQRAVSAECESCHRRKF